ncbi:MAG: hypothetical protein OQK29_06615 [Ignavibacteriaceae bacterium]|nr:hypothetical protein [Ignavibacteriaceae bacterium]
MSIRNVVVYLTYTDSPKDSVRAFSVFPGYDGTYELEGRLIGSLTFEVSVSTWIQTDSTTSGISNIQLANADGALDDFALEEFIEVEIAEIIDGTKTTLASGQIEQAYFDGEKTLNFKVKDVTKFLDIPMQDNFFPASETSDTGSGTNTYYALEGQPRPIAFGRPKSIKPVLAKRSNNEYHVHEDTANKIDITYDEGVVVTHTDQDKGFTLSTNPNGVVVADVRGANKVGGSSDARNLEDIFDWIFDKHSITNYSTSDLSTIDTDKGYLYSYYQDNTQNPQVKDVIKWFCDSFTGWYYSDENGDIRFGYLQEPAVSADVDITQLDIVGGINIFDDLAPNLTVKLGATRNYYVYNSDDIASGATAQNKIDLAQQWRGQVTGVNSIDDFYTSTNQIHDTLIQGSVSGQSEADNITDIYSQRRRFYSINSSIKADIGETVNLTYDRFGLDSGTNLLCVGKTIDFINNVYRLTLWG